MTEPPPSMLRGLIDVALDLTASLDSRERYQRLIATVRRVVPCDAAALLRLDRGALVAVATAGLSPEALGRRFLLADHPRLAAIIAARGPLRFAADDPRPDPYDGLVADSPDRHPHVHACMGSPLYVGDELVGALTVDALRPGSFDALDDDTVAIFAALAAATFRTASLIDALERVAERRGRVAEHLVTTALERQGGELVGSSVAMARLRDDVALAARSGLTTLITGETGVGKELVARMVHANSARASEPLVYVNCAALPEALAESELFGHARGAFTGAVEDRAGKFDLADRGTLFLDEIGELPLAVQAKLLRALQSGEIQRVGADRELRVDVRVLAATNRDLATEVATGRFRADLYHRLAVFPIHVPPLRERAEDALVLAGLFADRARQQLRLGAVHLSPAARAAILRYPWPGNVRELEHALVRAALRASAGRPRAEVVLSAADLGLEPAPAGMTPAAPRTDTGPATAPPAELPLADATDAYQRERIRAAVGAAAGNWAEAARRLGVDRGNLHRLARRLGLKPAAKPAPRP